VPGQRGGLRSGATKQVPDVGHVAVEPRRRHRVRDVGRVAVAELQRPLLARNPVPDDVVREPGTVWPLWRDVLAGRAQPGVEEVLLGPRIGAEGIAEGARGGAAVIAAGPLAVREHLPVLVVPPDEPLIDLSGFNPRAEARAPDEPEAILHSVEPGGVVRDVLPGDARLGGDHAVDRADQPR